MVFSTTNPELYSDNSFADKNIYLDFRIGKHWFTRTATRAEQVQTRRAARNSVRLFTVLRFAETENSRFNGECFFFFKIYTQTVCSRPAFCRRVPSSEKAEPFK